ncbi:unnamed protein product [Timema podura]|uniref:Uncharacterized protein n=1 Tax=Timema podura TaxID=61482 RepID=A0ABN7PJX9_TIMPD|nr:unnamed protein product [Timema podura]
MSGVLTALLPLLMYVRSVDSSPTSAQWMSGVLTALLPLLGASEQYRRYEGLSSQCKAVLPSTDLAHFVRSVTVPQHHPHRPSLRHNFLAPQPPPPPEVPDGPGGGAPHDNTPNCSRLVSQCSRPRQEHSTCSPWSVIPWRPPVLQTSLQDLNPPPPLKNELVVDRLVNLQPRSRFEALKKEALELDTQIKQLQDSLDTLLRIQQR